MNILYLVIGSQCALVLLLTILFFFLHRRVESLAQHLKSSVEQLTKWLEVVRDNQDVLQKDFKKLYEETHKYKQEIDQKIRQVTKD